MWRPLAVAVFSLGLLAAPPPATADSWHHGGGWGHGHGHSDNLFLGFNFAAPVYPYPLPGPDRVPSTAKLVPIPSA